MPTNNLIKVQSTSDNKRSSYSLHRILCTSFLS